MNAGEFSKYPADRVSTYFITEIPVLIVVTLTGIVYNIGLAAGPWFEGQLAQCLDDIFSGAKTGADMLRLTVIYAAVILLVQAARFEKRLYVRKFANNIGKKMKMTLYSNLLEFGRNELEDEGAGSLMTKAISDVDACVEGIRKATTEVFDTGIALVSYLVLLFSLDFRLALLACIFPPLAFYCAEKLKVKVTKSTAIARKSAGMMTAASYESVSGALTYRVYGQELNRQKQYEKYLSDYEKKNIKANLFLTTTQPVYKVISMTGIILVLYFGSKNVLGSGWSAWNIASFTAFTSCFARLSLKASKSAKLFNAIQKAEVSWKRISKYLHIRCENENAHESASGEAQGSAKKTDDIQDLQYIQGLQSGDNCVLELSDVSFGYEGETLVSGIDLTVKKGEIIGVTGPVACGKSSFGRIFIGEVAYSGCINGVMNAAYMGHDPELMNASIEENISLGKVGDVKLYLERACILDEVMAFPDGVQTRIGEGGVRLSGGQKQRIAFARTLFHRKPLMVLDDPFSAVDMGTENRLYENLRELCKKEGLAVILISHRLSVFPKLDKTVIIEDGRAVCGTHEALLLSSPTYAKLFSEQNMAEGDSNVPEFRGSSQDISEKKMCSVTDLPKADSNERGCDRI